MAIPNQIPQYNSHPVCNIEALSFFKTKLDGRYRMGINHPDVQDVEACCYLTQTDGYNDCPEQLDTAYAKLVGSDLWQSHQRELFQKALLWAHIERSDHPISALIDFFSPQSEIRSAFKLDVTEPSEANFVGVLGFGGGLLVAGGALIVAFGNFSAIQQETSSWFRTNEKVPPITVVIEDVEDAHKGERNRCQELINQIFVLFCEGLAFTALVETTGSAIFIPRMEDLQRAMDTLMNEIESIPLCKERLRKHIAENQDACRAMIDEIILPYKFSP